MYALVSRVHALSEESASDEFGSTKDELASLIKDCAALRKRLEGSLMKYAYSTLQ